MIRLTEITDLPDGQHNVLNIDHCIAVDVGYAAARTRRWLAPIAGHLLHIIEVHCVIADHISHHAQAYHLHPLAADIFGVEYHLMRSHLIGRKLDLEQIEGRIVRQRYDVVVRLERDRLFDKRIGA